MDYMAHSMSDYKAAMINYKIAFEPGAISFNKISDEISINYKRKTIELESSHSSYQDTDYDEYTFKTTSVAEES